VVLGHLVDLRLGKVCFMREHTNAVLKDVVIHTRPTSRLK